jgi:predicted lysophospholipase L1 biosynthesis ABC-type transport system permease subunit
MKFILQMAVRETRAAAPPALLFVCIAIGVAAIVALRSVIHSVRDVLAGQGVVADVTITTRLDACRERSHRSASFGGARHRPHRDDLDANDGETSRRLLRRPDGRAEGRAA